MAASDLLTEEELEQAKLADMDDDERAELEGLAGDDDDDDKADDKADDKDGAEGKADEGEESDDDDRPELQSTFSPNFNGGDRAAFDDQLKGIREQRAALNRQWRNGEIEDDDYDAKVSELEDQKDTIIEQRAMARTAETISVQSAQQAFARDKSNFLRTMEKYESVAYSKHGILSATFEQELQAAAKRAIDDKRDPSATELFEEAHAKVIEQMAALGVTVGRKAGAKADAKPEDRQKAADKPTEQRQVPRTLGGLPSAAPSGGIGNDLLTQAAELDGEDLELFIARLPADKRRLLDSAG